MINGMVVIVRMVPRENAVERAGAIAGAVVLSIFIFLVNHFLWWHVLDMWEGKRKI